MFGQVNRRVTTTIGLGNNLASSRSFSGLLPPGPPIGRPSPGTLSFALVNLDLETNEQEGRSVVSLRGEIDVYTAPRLRQALIDLVNGGANDIVVDMERVEFLDSTGLGVLVGGLKRVKSNEGSLRLVITQDRIMKIFDITGLSKVFPIHGSVEEALQA